MTWRDELEAAKGETRPTPPTSIDDEPDGGPDSEGIEHQATEEDPRDAKPR